MRLTSACAVLCGWSVLTPQGVWAQATPLKSYKTQEAYCADNPKAPTCIKMKPLTVEMLNPGYKPLPRSSAATPRVTTVVPPAPTMIVLGEPDWRFAHARADMLGGVNITGMVRSPIFRMLVGELVKSGLVSEADVESALSRAGDIEKVSISVRAKDILVLMTGKLDSMESLAKPGGGMSFHRVSADSILLGTEPSLSEAMRRLAVPAPAATGQAKRAKDLSQVNDFWVTGSPSLLATFGTPARGGDIRDFTLSLQLRDQLRMDIVLNAPTPASAQRMFATYQQNARGKALPGRQSAQLEGSAVHFVYTLQEAEVRAGLQEFMAGSGGKQMAALIAAGKQSVGESAPPRAQSPGKVLIYGLEGGPKEIPLSKP